MAQPGKLTLVHALPCRSARVVHLLEELKDAGVDLSDRIEVNKMEFGDMYMMGGEYKKLEPMSTIPVLTDHKGIYINESCGILLYILKFFGQGHLQPTDGDAAGWAEFLNWMFRAETVLSDPLSRWMLHTDQSPLPAHLRRPDVAEAAWQTALKGYQVLEDTLQGKEFLVNNTFSAADIAVVYSAGFWVAMFPDMSSEPGSKFPNIRRYNDRIMPRPAAARVWEGFQPPPKACEEYVPPAGDTANDQQRPAS